MDHTNKYTTQDLAETESSTFSGLRNHSPPTKREIKTSSPAAELTDEQICEHSCYWLADWNLSGMH